MNNKDIILGIVIGLIASVIGFLLAVVFFGGGNSIADSYNKSIAQGFFTKLVSIGALLNLAAFFLFIQKGQDLRAKGVLIATIFVALLTLIVRFF